MLNSTHFFQVASHALNLAALDDDGGPVDCYGVLAEVQLAPTLTRK